MDNKDTDNSGSQNYGHCRVCGAPLTIFETRTMVCAACTSKSIEPSTNTPSGGQNVPPFSYRPLFPTQTPARVTPVPSQTSVQASPPIRTQETVNLAFIVLFFALIYVFVDWLFNFTISSRPIDWIMIGVNLPAKVDFLADIFLDADKWSLGKLLASAAFYIPLKINWGFPVIGMMFLMLALNILTARQNCLLVIGSLIIASFVIGHFFGLVYTRSAAKEIDAILLLDQPANTPSPTIEALSAKGAQIEAKQKHRIELKLEKASKFARNLPPLHFQKGRFLALCGDFSSANQCFLSVAADQKASDMLKDKAIAWQAVISGKSPMIAEKSSEQKETEKLEKREAQFEKNLEIYQLTTAEAWGVIVTILILIMMNVRSGLTILGSSILGSLCGILLGSIVRYFIPVPIRWDAIVMLWFAVLGSLVLYIVTWLHLILRAVYPVQPLNDTDGPSELYAFFKEKILYGALLYIVRSIIMLFGIIHASALVPLVLRKFYAQKTEEQSTELLQGKPFIDEKIVSFVIPFIFCAIIIFFATFQASFFFPSLIVTLLTIAIVIAGCVIYLKSSDRQWLSRYRMKSDPQSVDCLESGVFSHPDPHWKSDGTLRKARIWERMCSLGIDYFILYLIITPILMIFGFTNLSLGRGLFLHTWFLYELLLIAYSGQTIGMRFLGLVCTGRDGKVIGIFRSFFRFWIGFFLYPIGLIVGLISKRNQMLHDKIVRTYVLSVKNIPLWRKIIGHIAGGLFILQFILMLVIALMYMG